MRRAPWCGPAQGGMQWWIGLTRLIQPHISGIRHRPPRLDDHTCTAYGVVTLCTAHERSHRVRHMDGYAVYGTVSGSHLNQQLHTLATVLTVPDGAQRHGVSYLDRGTRADAGRTRAGWPDRSDPATDSALSCGDGCSSESSGSGCDRDIDGVAAAVRGAAPTFSLLSRTSFVTAGWPRGCGAVRLGAARGWTDLSGRFLAVPMAL